MDRKFNNKKYTFAHVIAVINFRSKHKVTVLQIKNSYEFCKLIVILLKVFSANIKNELFALFLDKEIKYFR